MENSTEANEREVLSTNCMSTEEEIVGVAEKAAERLEKVLALGWDPCKHGPVPQVSATFGGRGAFCLATFTLEQGPFGWTAWLRTCEDRERKSYAREKHPEEALDALLETAKDALQKLKRDIDEGLSALDEHTK